MRRRFPLSGQDVPVPMAVLFDMDGVIAETEDLKARAHVIAANELGGRARVEMYDTVMGESFETVRDAFLSAGGAQARLDAYQQRYVEAYATLLRAGVQPVRGVTALIHLLRDCGADLAIVTSSERWAMQEVISQLGIEDSFRVFVAHGDFACAKPSPDPYLVAMQRLACPAEAAVAIEDTGAGVAAAIAAGIPVIGRRHRLNQKHTFGGALEFRSFEPAEDIVRLLAQAASSIRGAG